MKKNVGSFDRILRIVLALLIGYLYYNGTISGVLGIVLLVVAVVFLLTGLISSCPLYSIVGIKTCKIKEK